MRTCFVLAAKSCGKLEVREDSEMENGDGQNRDWLPTECGKHGSTTNEVRGFSRMT